MITLTMCFFFLPQEHYVLNDLSSDVISPTGRVIELYKNVELENVKFTQCYSIGVLAEDATGGAIFIVGYELTVTNCEFEDNYAINAGAVFMYQVPKSNFISCVFNANRAKSHIGAIWIHRCSDVTFSKCEFKQNDANDSFGCLYLNNSNVEVIECKFTENKANDGALDIGLVKKSVVDIKDSYFNNTYSTTPVIYAEASENSISIQNNYVNNTDIKLIFAVINREYSFNVDGYFCTNSKDAINQIDNTEKSVENLIKDVTFAECPNQVTPSSSLSSSHSWSPSSLPSSTQSQLHSPSSSASPSSSLSPSPTSESKDKNNTSLSLSIGLALGLLLLLIILIIICCCLCKRKKSYSLFSINRNKKSEEKEEKKKQKKELQVPLKRDDFMYDFDQENHDFKGVVFLNPKYPHEDSYWI